MAEEHPPAREGREKQRWDGDLRLVTGCLPVHSGRVYMIKSRKKADWVLPKGGWESDETAQECARREAYEEAGVEGEIGELLYESEVIKKKSQSRVTWFVMNVTRVLDEWPEMRPRCVLSLEEAMATCNRPEMIAAMRSYQSKLAAAATIATAPPSQSEPQA